MSLVLDLIATSSSFLKIGLGSTALRLKNNSGALVLRNNGDTADADLTVNKMSISGDVAEWNSDAAGSGADWKYTIQRPSSGMTAAVTLTLPVDDGTPGQILSTDGSGVLSWVSAGSTASSLKLDTTSLAFGSTSPVAMFSTGAADIIEYIDVFVDTAFNGTPSMSVGISGTTSKYMPATAVDLTTAGQYRYHPAVAAAGAEALIITYSAGGASAGAARVVVHYATPS